MIRTGGRLFALFRGRPAALAALAALVAIVVAALGAPLWATHDPLAVNAPARLSPPGAEHWFGTDHFGRDTFSRVVYGARQALLIGVGAVGFALVFGVAIAVLSAWMPRLGHLLMRAVDVLMAFPALLLALALIVVLGRGVGNVVVAVGAVYLATTARVVYGLALRIKAEGYVEAAESMGGGTGRIALRHMLPNLASPILVQASFVFAFAQLQAASLDFLGLGLPPEIPSWGNMLAESRIYITRAPWLLMFPGAMIIVTTLSLNLVGDALRDHLDPRLRGAFGGGR